MSEIKVNSIKGVGASVAALSINNTDGTCTANITNNLSNRNVVINGAMLINQRASSYTSTGEEYLLDRFNHRTGSGFTFDTTTTQDTSTPDGFSKSLKITPDSTQTPTGSHNAMLGHLIEADNLLGFNSGTSSAKKFVLSFYAKSASQNNNHNYSVQLSKLASSGTYFYVTKAFTVTSTWQRFTIPFVADTSNNITTGSGEGLRILWHLAAGSDDIGSEVSTWTSGNVNRGVTGQSNFMDNTSNEFYLTGVQLEASDSDVATDFEHRSFGQELALCQRYCYVDRGSEDYHVVAQGHFSGSGTAMAMLYLPVCMRAAPTLAYPVGTWIFSADSGTIAQSNIFPQDNIGGVNAIHIRGAVSGAPSGEGFLLRTSSSGHTWILHAEL